MKPDGGDPYAVIDQLLDSGDLPAAREALQHEGEDDATQVLRIKLAMYDGSLHPGAAMQRLIQLMRRDPHIRGAKELYQRASGQAYQKGQSSVSHSHPPPPVTNTDDK